MKNEKWKILGSPAHCPLPTLFCLPPSSFCLLFPAFHRFQFWPGNQQWFGDALEIFEFPWCNLNTGREYATNSLREKFAGNQCRGADQFHYVAATAPMFA